MPSRTSLPGARSLPLRTLILTGALVSLLVACSSSKPMQPLAPAWEQLPGGVLDALCSRLAIDAIASGAPLTLVSTTQPIANAESMTALGSSAQARRARPESVTEAMRLGSRSMPVTLGTACPWNPVPAIDPRRHADEMVVELSAPLPNPFAPHQAGIFARVSLGGTQPAWYWISLVPRADGSWGIGSVTPFAG